MDPDSVAGAGTDRISAAHSYFVNQLSMWVDDLPAGEEDEYFDALRDTIYGRQPARCRRPRVELRLGEAQSVMLRNPHGATIVRRPEEPRPRTARTLHAV